MKARVIAVFLVVIACLVVGAHHPRSVAGAPVPGPGPQTAADAPAPPAEGKKAEPAPPAEPILQNLPDPVKKLDDVPDFFSPPGPAQPGAAAQTPDEMVTMFSAEVLETYVTFFPARSTRIGVRTLDTNLADHRKENIDAVLELHRGYLKGVELIPTDGLSEKGRIERESLRVHLRSVVRQLDTLGAPQRDPNFYVDESVGAITESLDHDEAGAIERAAHVLARLTIIPSYLDLAKQNLTTCSKPAVRRAIVRLRASAPIFVTQLPAYFRGSGNPKAAKQGEGASLVAWKSVAALADWLEKQKLPDALEAAPVGNAGWRAWILAREDQDLDPAIALAAAEADLAKLDAELRAEASRLAPGKTPAVLVAEIAAERVEPDLARKQAENTIIPGLWEWMIHERPLNPPSAQVIEVRETPTLRRREAPVRADLPGGFSKPDATAYLEIAPPDPDWPTARMLAWISGYGRSFIKGALAREVYPGRFVAWQKARKATSRANRTLDFPVMTGGWGLYAEEIALRRGYASGDARARIAMLVDLIRADLRLIAAARIHTKQMPRQAAAELLRTKGYWSRPESEEEADRILADLDAAAPALGRLAILALRDDAKKAGGAAFVERDFHDRVISYGSAPVSVLRRAILPGSEGGLLGPVKQTRSIPMAPTTPPAFATPAPATTPAASAAPAATSTSSSVHHGS